MRELSKTYDPADVEGRLYAWWEASGFFAAEPDDPGDPFVIAMPPPNVTGSLHLGHAMYVVQDAFIRRARMQGRNAVWLPGMDHAGIATQNVVERELAKEGLSRHDVGREAFVERVWQWKEQYGGTILRQLRRLGFSPDWRREAFTLDEPRSRAVREVFCLLYDEGLIYRGNRIINWCPRCLTALSDIEVDHVDVEGELAYLRYPAPDGSGGLTVATTRAETMLGDTGVAVHPQDERFAQYVGGTVILPLLDREIPVVADEHVDPEFGTGAVKVTPAHDPNDYEIGRRHGLDAINVMTDEAKINANGGPYEGLDRFEARTRVKADLAERGLLVRVEPRVHQIGHCSRCGTVVEPRLSEQWFVEVAPLAEKAMAAVRDGRTSFVPQRNEKGFLDWLENLHDWCISRQLWWGHRIPAWYDREGAVHVLREDPSPEEIAERGLTQDPDVLDTWFSSQLWPFTTLGWTGPGSDTPELRAWYPTSVLETGYDINTFWVSRMLMIGVHVLDAVPFRVVFNHGLVRDKLGKKMSKSAGNVIDPLDLIERYGADALRFALLRAASPGQDSPIAEEWVEGARRFTNKLWNAARFVLLSVSSTREGLPSADALALEDRWILSRLEATRVSVNAAMDAYDLADAARTIYHFIWDEYCDWYLELAKQRVRAAPEWARDEPAGDDVDARAASGVLVHVLETALRLLHPLMPFVTEEIWRTLVDADESTALMVSAWPEGAAGAVDRTAEAQFAALREVVTELRRFRADHGLSPAKRMDVIARAEPSREAVFTAALEGIRRLTGVDDWTFSSETVADGPMGKVPVSGADLFVPLTGLVDLDEERQRLSKERGKAEAELKRAEGKLANRGFVEKAPAPVVEAERAKVAEWRAAVDRLTAQLDELA